MSLTLLISSFLIIKKLDFKNLVSLLPHLPFFTLRFQKKKKKKTYDDQSIVKRNFCY